MESPAELAERIEADEPYKPYHPQPFEPRYLAARVLGWGILAAILGLAGYALWHHGFL